MHGLHAVLTGFRKYTPSKGQKQPIIDKILRRFIDKLDMNRWNESVLGTALIFKKSMILRNSEGWKWDRSTDGIKLKDLVFIKNKYNELIGLKWIFNKSKTNTLGAIEFAIAPCVCNIGKLCGPHAVEKHLQLRRDLGCIFG